MRYCPYCGSEAKDSDLFCENCGKKLGTEGRARDAPPQQQAGYAPHQQPQPYRASSGVQYDSLICLLICCCLTPVGAVIYYLLADHQPTYGRTSYYPDDRR
jgi:hypothetical protein